MSHSLVRAESLSRADLINRIFRHIMKSWDFHEQEYFFKLFISATGCLFFCTKTKSTSHLNSTFLGIVMAISTIYAPRIIARPRRGRCLHMLLFMMMTNNNIYAAQPPSVAAAALELVY